MAENRRLRTLVEQNSNNNFTIPIIKLNREFKYENPITKSEVKRGKLATRKLKKIFNTILILSENEPKDKDVSLYKDNNHSRTKCQCCNSRKCKM